MLVQFQFRSWLVVFQTRNENATKIKIISKAKQKCLQNQHFCFQAKISPLKL